MNRIDRYKILIRYLKNNRIVSSQKDLAEKLGYTNESSFSQVINEKVKTPENFHEKLKTLVPELNVGWLITGEGDMLLSSQSVPEEENFLSVQDKRMAKFVPLIPVEAQGGSLNDFVYSINQSDCEIIASPIKYVDFAIQVSGDSMAPEYPSGSYVYVKEINERAFIEWGKVYVLDTCNGSVIKVLTPSSREGYVRCISINTDPIYAPFEISLNDIRRVYRVMLCMSIK